MRARTVARVLLAGSLAAECSVAAFRFEARRRAFTAAQRRAVEMGRRLIVVGDPDAGAHTRLVRAYGCGDLCVDLHGCPRCDVMEAVDLTRGRVAGVEDDSAVVFVSCVLEYVQDPVPVMRELLRMAGSPDNLFLVFVEPVTFTATLYPGARWTGFTREGHVNLVPVTKFRKAVTAASLVVLAALALRRDRA